MNDLSRFANALVEQNLMRVWLNSQAMSIGKTIKDYETPLVDSIPTPINTEVPVSSESGTHENPPHSN